MWILFCHNTRNVDSIYHNTRNVDSIYRNTPNVDTIYHNIHHYVDSIYHSAHRCVDIPFNMMHIMLTYLSKIIPDSIAPSMYPPPISDSEIPMYTASVPSNSFTLLNVGPISTSSRPYKTAISPITSHHIRTSFIPCTTIISPVSVQPLEPAQQLYLLHQYLF